MKCGYVGADKHPKDRYDVAVENLKGRYDVEEFIIHNHYEVSPEWHGVKNVIDKHSPNIL